MITLQNDDAIPSQFHIRNLGDDRIQLELETTTEGFIYQQQYSESISPAQWNDLPWKRTGDGQPWKITLGIQGLQKGYIRIIDQPLD